MNTTFPNQLRVLHDGLCEQLDIDLYRAFLSEAELLAFLRPWTGNPEVPVLPLLAFASDGTGGLIGMWGEEEDLIQRPIVMLGSEGRLAVLASNLGDFVELLVQGWSPYQFASESLRSEGRFPASVKMPAAVYELASGLERSEIERRAMSIVCDFKRVIQTHIR